VWLVDCQIGVICLLLDTGRCDLLIGRLIHWQSRLPPLKASSSAPTSFASTSLNLYMEVVLLTGWCTRLFFDCCSVPNIDPYPAVYINSLPGSGSVILNYGPGTLLVIFFDCVGVICWLLCGCADFVALFHIRKPAVEHQATCKHVLLAIVFMWFVDWFGNALLFRF
jgi:hypothetical protein